MYLLNAIKWLNRVRKPYLILGVLISVVVITYGDCITGPLVPFTYFYLMPIIFSAFFLGSRCTYFIIILSIIAGIPCSLKLEELFGLVPVVADFLSEAIIYITFAFLSLELKKVLFALESLASEDFLTKAHSSRYFYEYGTNEIAKAYRSKQPMSVVFIDLDNFKKVNDTRGHRAGDELLVKVASSIRCCLREGDILGRLGGDEFAVILTQTDQENAKAFFRRLYKRLLKDIELYQTSVTLSAGVVTYLADKTIEIDELITLADNAMYDVKNSTKNSTQYVTI